MEHKLLKKLLIKAGNQLLISNAPDNIATVLGEIPADIQSDYIAGKVIYDAVLLFVKDSKELGKLLPAALKKVHTDAKVWIIYPKKSSGIPTDLGMMAPWAAVGRNGYDTVAAAAISDDWTALRIRPVGQSKPSGLCNDDIAGSEHGQFIDVAKRTVTAPPDLATAFNAYPDAQAFFEQLSFTNKKEYALWLLTAKQEKTRIDRLAKTIDKLNAGKKNPSEK